jgi:hypothetical protein
MCLSGISGGAWIVAGAANLLAKSNELRHIQLIVLMSAMLSDVTSKVPDDQLHVYEKEWANAAKVMTSAYKCHATDYAN